MTKEKITQLVCMTGEMFALTNKGKIFKWKQEIEIKKDAVNPPEYIKKVYGWVEWNLPDLGK